MNIWVDGSTVYQQPQESTMKPITFISRHNADEVAHLHFMVEASFLRWPPGFAPSVLKTSLGNQLSLFLIRTDRTPSGDIGGWVYRQVGGCITVTVAND